MPYAPLAGNKQPVKHFQGRIRRFILSITNVAISTTG